MARSIDSLYLRAVQKLTSKNDILGISMKLASLNTNSERTLYVHGILKNLKLLPENLKVSKSEHLSDRYRELGNDCFKKHKNYEALQYYNLSLMYAPLGSDQLSLAYANRSAVHFDLKQYNECSNDINTVFKLNYPEKLKSKLLNRQMQCRMAEPIFADDNYARNINNILKSMPSRHPRYVCATNKIDVLTSENMGRHVVAIDDIEVGEVIAVENPYVSLTLAPQALFSCGYCFARSGNLLPCDNCCFTLYCSETCKSQAVREHHSVECPLMATLTMMQFTKLELLALRTVLKVRSECHNWNSVLELIRDIENSSGSEYHGHVSVDGTYVYDSKYYNSIHTLATNLEKRSMSDVFQKAVTAAVFLHLLDFTEFIREFDEKLKERIKECVGGLLLQHIMTSPTNMHSVSSTIESDGGQFTCEADLGSAAYAFLSLINHSCAPNVVRFNRLGTTQTTLVSLRPIKKGMQIFDNYGSHHALQSKKERYDSLKFQYKFDCACEACSNEWPMYLSLSPAKNLPSSIRATKEMVLNPDTVDQLQMGNLQVALETYRSLCDVAGALDVYAPCVELADCQEAMKQCLFLVHGTMTRGYSRLVGWVSLVSKDNW